MDKTKRDILQFAHSFADEMKNQYEWMSFHLWEMMIEVEDIKNALEVFKVVQDEWERRVATGKRVEHSILRNTLFYALTYRVVLGLSRIFVGGTNGFSLGKTVNTISQMQEFRSDTTIQALIQRVEVFLSSNKMVQTVSVIRDQFFAHLDRRSVITDYRIDPSMALKDIHTRDIEDGAKLIRALNKACYNQQLKCSKNEITRADILRSFFLL